MKSRSQFFLRIIPCFFLLFSGSQLSVAQESNAEYTNSSTIDRIDKQNFELVMGDVLFYIKPNAVILDNDGTRLNLFSNKLIEGQEVEVTYKPNRRISKIVIQ